MWRLPGLKLISVENVGIKLIQVGDYGVMGVNGN